MPMRKAEIAGGPPAAERPQDTVQGTTGGKILAYFRPGEILDSDALAARSGKRRDYFTGRLPGLAAAGLLERVEIGRYRLAEGAETE